MLRNLSPGSSRREYPEIIKAEKIIHFSPCTIISKIGDFHTAFTKSYHIFLMCCRKDGPGGEVEIVPFNASFAFLWPNNFYQLAFY